MSYGMNGWCKEIPTEERTEKRTETHACDCISREAAIDQLRQSYNLLDAEQRLEDLPSAQPTDADIQKMQDIEQAMLDKAYECGKQDAVQWIPCKERLPESSSDDLEYPTVIICCDDGTVTLACYYESTKEWGCGENFDSKCFPSAWMPLPEPYREDDHETD